MNGFLFEHIVFGPIRSRRLGISLGVNLLPTNCKVCTFNCLYCECGWTRGREDEGTRGREDEGTRGREDEGTRGPGAVEQGGDFAAVRERERAWFPERGMVKAALEKKLADMHAKKSMLTSITFAGNGEPALHPEFAGIIDDTIDLRGYYFPQAWISVLSNATCAGDDDVAAALMKVDQNILKLDAGTEETLLKINNPIIKISLSQILDNLMRFKGKMIIQTLFVKGSYRGVAFDNTTDAEVEAWLKHIKRLRPQSVMIYPIARATPAEDVHKIGAEKLQEIASKVEALGIKAEVSY